MEVRQPGNTQIDNWRIKFILKNSLSYYAATYLLLWQHNLEYHIIAVNYWSDLFSPCEDWERENYILMRIINHFCHTQHGFEESGETHIPT